MCARRTRFLVVSVLVLVVSLPACGGDRSGTADTAAADTNTAAVPPADTGGAPGQVTPQLIALGDSIFKGQAAGGICFTCHGPDAKGTTLAPNLTDTTWLNGDGSLSFIANTVRQGVPTPKQFPAPMPAFGQMLNAQQVNAVSAYVYSLSHPRSAARRPDHPARAGASTGNSGATRCRYWRVASAGPGSYAPYCHPRAPRAHPTSLTLGRCVRLSDRIVQRQPPPRTLGGFRSLRT